MCSVDADSSMNVFGSAKENGLRRGHVHRAEHSSPKHGIPCDCLADGRVRWKGWAEVTDSRCRARKSSSRKWMPTPITPERRVVARHWRHHDGRPQQSVSDALPDSEASYEGKSFRSKGEVGLSAPGHSLDRRYHRAEKSEVTFLARSMVTSEGECYGPDRLWRQKRGLHQCCWALTWPGEIRFQSFDEMTMSNGPREMLPWSWSVSIERWACACGAHGDGQHRRFLDLAHLRPEQGSWHESSPHS